MAQKWKNMALLLLLSFLITESGKSVHFLFFHHPQAHQECSAHCSDTQSAEKLQTVGAKALSTTEAPCPYEKVNYFPFEAALSLLQVRRMDRLYEFRPAAPSFFTNRLPLTRFSRGPPATASFSA